VIHGGPSCRTQRLSGACGWLTWINADEHPPAGQNIAEKLVSCTRLLI